eukprot:GFYU01002128.1.p1 GENE.GFYU01002128.1~~GFYU01002128.1.p1  ORF type:complete len:1619 (+),score=333.48 GFYU01002128.1:160-4857(+)
MHKQGIALPVWFRDPFSTSGDAFLDMTSHLQYIYEEWGERMHKGSLASSALKMLTVVHAGQNTKSLRSTVPSLLNLMSERNAARAAPFFGQDCTNYGAGSAMSDGLVEVGVMKLRSFDLDDPKDADMEDSEPLLVMNANGNFEHYPTDIQERILDASSVLLIAVDYQDAISDDSLSEVWEPFASRCQSHECVTWVLNVPPGECPCRRDNEEGDDVGDVEVNVMADSFVFESTDGPECACFETTEGNASKIKGVCETVGHAVLDGHHDRRPLVQEALVDLPRKCRELVATITSQAEDQRKDPGNFRISNFPLQHMFKEAASLETEKIKSLKDRPGHFGMRRRIAMEYTQRIQSTWRKMFAMGVRHISNPSSFLSQFLDAEAEAQSLGKEYVCRAAVNAALSDGAAASKKRQHQKYTDVSTKLLRLAPQCEGHAVKDDEKCRQRGSLIQQQKSLANQMSLLELSVGHFYRELAVLYEAFHIVRMDEGAPDEDKKILRSFDSTFFDGLIVMSSNNLLRGHSLELLDGDAQDMPRQFVQAVLERTTKALGDPNVVVHGVFGPQSSGKTLWVTTAYGTTGKVDISKTTTGISMYLVTTKDGYVIVIDMEGIENVEADREHDNRMVAFLMMLCNVVVFNTDRASFGPSLMGTLQMVVASLMMLKQSQLADIKVVLQHQRVAMTDANAPGLHAEATRNIDLMNEAVKVMSELLLGTNEFESLDQIMRYDSAYGTLYLPDAFTRDGHTKLPNDAYGAKVTQGVHIMLDGAASQKMSSWMDRVKHLETIRYAEDMYIQPGILEYQAKGIVDKMVAELKAELDQEGEAKVTSTILELREVSLNNKAKPTSEWWSIMDTAGRVAKESWLGSLTLVKERIDNKIGVFFNSTSNGHIKQLKTGSIHSPSDRIQNHYDTVLVNGNDRIALAVELYKFSEDHFLCAVLRRALADEIAKNRSLTSTEVDNIINEELHEYGRQDPELVTSAFMLALANIPEVKKYPEAWSWSVELKQKTLSDFIQTVEPVNRDFYSKAKALVYGATIEQSVVDSALSAAVRSVVEEDEATRLSPGPLALELGKQLHRLKKQVEKEIRPAGDFQIPSSGVSILLLWLMEKVAEKVTEVDARWIATNSVSAKYSAGSSPRKRLTEKISKGLQGTDDSGKAAKSLVSYLQKYLRNYIVCRKTRHALKWITERFHWSLEFLDLWSAAQLRTLGAITERKGPRATDAEKTLYTRVVDPKVLAQDVLEDLVGQAMSESQNQARYDMENGKELVVNLKTLLQESIERGSISKGTGCLDRDSTSLQSLLTHFSTSNAECRHDLKLDLLPDTDVKNVNKFAIVFEREYEKLTEEVKSWDEGHIKETVENAVVSSLSERMKLKDLNVCPVCGGLCVNHAESIKCVPLHQPSVLAGVRLAEEPHRGSVLDCHQHVERNSPWRDGKWRGDFMEYLRKENIEVPSKRFTHELSTRGGRHTGGSAQRLRETMAMEPILLTLHMRDKVAEWMSTASHKVVAPPDFDPEDEEHSIPKHWWHYSVTDEMNSLRAHICAPVDTKELSHADPVPCLIPSFFLRNVDPWYYT